MNLSSTILAMFGKGILDTLYMTLVASALAYILGIPIGILLCISDSSGIKPNKPLNTVLGIVVSLLRSVPFRILLVAIMPFTRAVVGTTIGPTATIVPLVVASAPFVGRIVESSLKEVDSGVIEAASSMGATTWQIIWKVLLPESKPSLLVGASIAVTTILGYSALAGFVGGGGLGAIALNYGYYRYNDQIMLISVILLVIIVQVFQEIGARIVKRADKRIRN